MKVIKLKIIIPIIISGLSGIDAFLLFYDYKIENFSSNLFSSIITFCGILIGLLFASLSILLSIEDKDIIQQLKVSGTYNNLIKRFSYTINLTFILLILSIFSICINFKEQENWHPYMFSIWVFLTVLCCIKYYQLINSLINILKASSKKSNIDFLTKQLNHSS